MNCNQTFFFFLAGASISLGWQRRCGEGHCFLIWPPTSSDPYSCRYWCTVLLVPNLPLIPCCLLANCQPINPPSNPRKFHVSSFNLCRSFLHPHRVCHLPEDCEYHSLSLFNFGVSKLDFSNFSFFISCTFWLFLTISHHSFFLLSTKNSHPLLRYLPSWGNPLNSSPSLPL